MLHLRTLIAIGLLPCIALAADPPASRPALVHDEDVQRLAIGSPAPDFDLPGVDGKRYSLKDFASAKVLMVVFTCNHCPTAQAYEGRIKQLAADYRDKGVAVVAISPNDPKSLRLNELGFTDLSDTLDEMKIRARQGAFNYPYLYDGDLQQVSRAYGPASTPTVFIFDAARKLRYVGRVDDAETVAKVKHHDAQAALDALLAGKPVPVETTKSFGCSIKWSGKRESVVQFMKGLADEPVTLEDTDLAGLKTLLENKTPKLVLVNFWATWCVPCVEEMPELVTMNRMYRHRGFELVTISTDEPARRGKALEVLKKLQCSSSNRLLGAEGKYEMIEAVDKDWSGALPYTALIAPGGKVLYRKQGPIDVLELRRAIVAWLGRGK
jgi:peroxiredoxin